MSPKSTEPTEQLENLAPALNPYSPPRAELFQPIVAHDDFYVVGKTKFLVLLFGTLGVYSLYWFFQQWMTICEREPSRNISPIARTALSIFYINPLVRILDKQLRLTAPTYAWRPLTLASIYILARVISGTIEMLLMKDIVHAYFSYYFLLTLPMDAWVMWQVQAAMNTACADQEGINNQNMTLANYFWLLVGFLLWANFLLDEWQLIDFAN
jgi:hypothetical protein